MCCSSGKRAKPASDARPVRMGLACLGRRAVEASARWQGCCRGFRSAFLMAHGFREFEAREDVCDSCCWAMQMGCDGKMCGMCLVRLVVMAVGSGRRCWHYLGVQLPAVSCRLPSLCYSDNIIKQVTSILLDILYRHL